MSAISIDTPLPELPGVPASIGPIGCPDCGTRQATVHHIPAGDDGDYTPTLICAGCGGCWELEAESYLAGLAAGVLAEHAKWHEAAGVPCGCAVTE